MESMLFEPFTGVQGIVGAMAWRYDGLRLRLVWFNPSDDLLERVHKGARLTTRPIATFEKIAAAKRVASRRWHARQRQT